MFKITYGSNQVIYCTDVKREIIKLLSKRYNLEYSIMTIDDIIDFAFESKTILTVEPVNTKLKEPMESESLMYDMDPIHQHYTKCKSHVKICRFSTLLTTY